MNMAGMKRSRENGEIDSIDMAKCLMLLSQSLESNYTNSRKSSRTDVFECKTCNRKFPSFQALGGHRASHKRPRLMDGDNNKCNNVTDHTPVKSLSLAITKPKMHECSICGQEFGLGQALGGHMRKHRVAMTENNTTTHFGGIDQVVVSKMTPVLRRSSSSKRVFGLDLNLTPLENDLEILFGKRAPKVGLPLF